MATDLAYSYAALEKADKNPDGTLTVYGKATDDSVDIDQQICDDAWLKKAMPDWMLAGGNVREQHSNIAAGVATEYEVKSDGHYITALVVDPVSVKKVETGVLKGFSIGIRGPRVIRDTKAAGGRIVDGQIVEVSLVDRPANPNAKLMLAKAVDGGSLEAVSETLKFNDNHDESGRFSSGSGSSAQSADRESLKPHERVSYDQFRSNGVDHESAVQMARRSTNRAESSKQYEERAKLGEGAQHYDNFRANGMGHRDALQMARNTVHADANAKSVDGDVLKFNENHDESGRFTSGDGASTGASKDAHEKAQRGLNDLRDHITGRTDISEEARTTANGHLDTAQGMLNQARGEHARGDSLAASLSIASAAAEARHAEEAIGSRELYANDRGLPESVVNSTPSNIGSQAISSAWVDYHNANNSTTVEHKPKSADGDVLKFNENHDERGRFSSGDAIDASQSAIQTARANIPKNQDEATQSRAHESVDRAGRAVANASDAFARGDRGAALSSLREASDHLATASEHIAPIHQYGSDQISAASQLIHNSVGAFITANPSGKSSVPTPKDVANMMKNLNKSNDIVDDVVEPDLVEAPVEDAPVEDAPESGVPVEDIADKSVEGDIVKGDIDLYNNAISAITALIKAEADEVVTEGDSEGKDIKQLLKSLKHLQKWHKIEFEKGELPELPSDDADTDDDFTPSVIELSVDAEDKADIVDDEMCDKCNKSMDECKCADKDAEKSVSFDDTQIESVIEKAVASAKASVTEELESLKTAIKAAEADKVQLMEDLDTARKAALAGGPKRSVVKASESVKSELLQKATEYRFKASKTLDKALAQGYREMADDLESKASRKDVN